MMRMGCALVPGYRILYGYAPPAQPIWLLEYNGEAHNLVERKNGGYPDQGKQFFDWLLKETRRRSGSLRGCRSLKGIDWGMGVSDDQRAILF